MGTYYRIEARGYASEGRWLPLDGERYDNPADARIDLEWERRRGRTVRLVEVTDPVTPGE